MKMEISDATPEEQAFFDDIYKIASKHINGKKIDPQSMCAMLAQLIGALVAYSSGCAPGETVVKDLVESNLCHGFDRMTERMEGERDATSGD